jgi:RNA polymerase sigma factor (sigma-70 family)
LPTEKQQIRQEWLVLRCKRGDSRALEELVRQWEDRLFYYVRRLVGTEADAWDVLQQTWMKALTAIKRLDNPRSLPAWLYRIARCTAASHWRGHYRADACREEDADLGQLAAPEEELHFDDAEQVHFGLSRISLAHREVLTLHFLDDLSLDEMAEVLDVPPGTVKSRLYYAKRALQAVLEQQEGNHE